MKKFTSPGIIPKDVKPMECKLANDYLLTEDEIEKRAALYESGKWEGTLGPIKPGKPLQHDEGIHLSIDSCNGK